VSTPSGAGKREVERERGRTQEVGELKEQSNCVSWLAIGGEVSEILFTPTIL